MGRKSRDSYSDALGRREVETAIAETFQTEFPVITGRNVTLLSESEAPDRIALIDGIETGVELTAIKADGADEILGEIQRLAYQKHRSYERHGVFAVRPIILLGHLDWPAMDVEGRALFDVHEELLDTTVASDFAGLGFSEIWLMDSGAKYTSRTDSRAPADFFCFAPADNAGFWQRERKRRPYFGLVRDFFV